MIQTANRTHNGGASDWMLTQHIYAFDVYLGTSDESSNVYFIEDPDVITNTVI